MRVLLVRGAGACSGWRSMLACASCRRLGCWLARRFNLRVRVEFGAPQPNTAVARRTAVATLLYYTTCTSLGGAGPQGVSS